MCGRWVEEIARNVSCFVRGAVRYGAVRRGTGSLAHAVTYGITFPRLVGSCYCKKGCLSDCAGRCPLLLSIFIVAPQAIDAPRLAQGVDRILARRATWILTLTTEMHALH